MVEKDFYPHDSEIDDITWYDLDLFEVFEMINSTYSSVGSEALYQQLRNFQFKPDRQLTALIDFSQPIQKFAKIPNIPLPNLGNWIITFPKTFWHQGRKKVLATCLSLFY